VLYLFDHFDDVREVLALRPFGLFTDVDGTISEIAPSPAEAKVSPVCREALATLAGTLPVVAAVSGRPAMEARKMVGIDNMVYIGNHGYERWIKGKTALLPDVEGYLARIRDVLDSLAGHIAIDGIIVENKGPTAAIHYRRCRDHEAALKSIVAAVEEPAKANDLKISLGKLVVELRPPLEVSKGTAVCSLIAEDRLNGAIYLGDDLTDVDVFRAFHQKGLSFKGLAIGVIDEEAEPDLVQEADFTLNGIEDVERFLKQVAAEVADMPAS
jgi:trehalose 6-phosphate phosphatase